ncbi:MAG TPA: 50S ribosomal protein L23 [Gammaproteobacteria bacterium]|nr:50S ribosomal protein L23 [Gammaproteobacteria bacterium]HQZ88040.1 50S ribosomal protein L23 [Gammaproteobacteria bacterium]HRA42497.1 50S ribosomal protein L23 [Gammaproteobacteria bacterium]
MNEKRLYTIILGPHTTEKAVSVADQIAFRVAKDATKTELKEAVQKLFSVKVVSVRIVNVMGKTRQFRQRQGERSDWKKAYVRLDKGQAINLDAFQ